MLSASSIGTVLMVRESSSALSSDLFDEILLCARYGDLEDLKSYCAQMSASLVKTALTQQDSRGNTALHFCAANGHSSVVKFFLSKETSGLDLRNEGGNTALHWACLNGHLDTVKLLIEYGAEVKLKNKAGRAPIDDAESQGKESIVLWLLALDMKREKDAGDAQKTKDEEEEDISLSFKAGDVEGPVSSNAEPCTPAQSQITQQLDQMKMLD